MEDFSTADVGPILIGEEFVPDYVLPELLRTARGQRIDSAAAWETERRPALLEAFRSHVYGRTPERPVELVEVRSETEAHALGGAAVRRQTRVELRVGDRSLPVDILLYLPRETVRPVPLFLGLNFFGNQSVHADPGIRLSERWMPDAPDRGIVDNRVTEAARGSRATYWAVENILARGYGLATAYYGDFDPDFDDGFRNGAHGLIDPGVERPPDAWGAIGAWAWGLSRTLDALERDPDVNASRVAVMGHSRLGKAALWAGVQDARFALVISNNSGCGGAALFRRCIGETVQAITVRFPHWFAKNFEAYAGREAALPIDQHQLLALVAPRPLYVASASEDFWADPRGEFLAAREASAAWSLYGRRGLCLDAFPDAGAGGGTGFVGYHLREGGHEVTAGDWDHYLDFADRHLSPGKATA